MRRSGRSEEVGDMVRRARIRSHMTQRELGHLLGMSGTAMSDVERGDRVLNERRLWVVHKHTTLEIFPAYGLLLQALRLPRLACLLDALDARTQQSDEGAPLHSPELSALVDAWLEAAPDRARLEARLAELDLHAEGGGGGHGNG